MKLLEFATRNMKIIVKGVVGGGESDSRAVCPSNRYLVTQLIKFIFAI
jgi:hypothetical protein